MIGQVTRKQTTYYMYLSINNINLLTNNTTVSLNAVKDVSHNLHHLRLPGIGDEAALSDGAEAQRAGRRASGVLQQAVHA